jgi:hypothetical protein
MTREEVQTAILTDVVARFVNLKERTSRRDLMIKYRSAGAGALGDLINRNFFRRKWSGGEEEYLPTAGAFQFCGDPRLRQVSKMGLTVVLHALQNMYVGERSKEPFTFEDLRSHVNGIYPDRVFDEGTLRLGLYLAQDFSVLAGFSPPEETEITHFQIGEGAITIENIEGRWDEVTGWYKLPQSVTQTEGTEMADGNSIDVFISHSSADIEVAQALIELLRSAMPGLHPTQIRCTSAPGYKLPGGADTNNQLRREMRGAKTFIGLLTEQSLRSTYVLFELGARWGADFPFTPLIASGLKMSDLKAPLSGLHAHSCDVEADLHQMLDEISEWLNLKKASVAVYDGQLKNLAVLSRAEGARRSKGANGEGQTRSVSADGVSLDRDSRGAHRKTQQGLSSDARLLLLECSKDAGGIVMCVPTLQGLVVSTNGKRFSEPLNPRSEARWKAAVEELVRLRLLEPQGSKGEVFGITNAGYEEADRVGHQIGGEPAVEPTRAFSLSLVAGGTPPSQTIKVTASSNVKIVRFEYMLSNETCIVGEDVSFQGEVVEIPVNHDLLRKVWNVPRLDRNNYDHSGPAKIGVTVSVGGRVRQFVLPVQMENAFLNNTAYAKLVGSKTFQLD